MFVDNVAKKTKVWSANVSQLNKRIMESALEVANKFLDFAQNEAILITPMKLQKLVYLAHGIHLATTEDSLIYEPVEAWKWGPVVPELYHIVKVWGNNNIQGNFKRGAMYGKSFVETPQDISNGSLISIKTAWNLAKNKSGEALSNWSHEKGSPWEKTYVEGVRNLIISSDTIKDYFKAFMKKPSEV